MVVTVKTGDMGLDGVELVMAVEDAFSISINDADAAKLLTLRLLTDYVLSKVTTTTATVCLTQRAFNLLRRSLLRHGGWKRSEITPDTSLPVLLPKKLRREIIQKVIADLEIKRPPEYVLAEWVNVLLLVGPALAGGTVAYGTGHATHSAGIWIFIGVALATAGIAVRLTRPLRTEFPRNLQTVGDLARWVMTHKSDLADATPTGWTREQITARVRELIVDQLGVKPGFSDDANFVKDLGLS
jgi:acyl carrier protein